MGYSGCDRDCFDHCEPIKVVLRNGCCIIGKFMGCCEVCDRHSKYMVIKGRCCKCYYVNPDQVLYITPCGC